MPSNQTTGQTGVQNPVDAYGNPYGYNPTPGSDPNTQQAYNSQARYQQNQYQQDQAAQQAALQKQLADQQNAANLAAQREASAANAAQQQAQIAEAQRQQQAQLDYQRSVDAYKQAQFNQVYGMLNGQAAALNANMPGAPGSAQQPQIYGGPMWTQTEINQNLNANAAASNRQTETTVNNQRSQLAGRGFGSRSPLGMALENQTRLGAMGQQADFARQFQQDTRRANVSHALDTQQAQEKQFSNRNQEANQRYNTQAQASSSLYNALANLI